ncbi:FtsX-like permease family protein [Phytohabitans flavus]|uniref:FtsX-like permease family protein n=1 Tax=Phytohabitans flavus TaxID=1076124 RepID=UPI00363FA97D
MPSVWMGARFTTLARFALTAAGVAVGVTLVLLTLTAVPALQGRDHRAAWHATTAASPATADRALWLASDDHFLGRDLFLVRVAALGPRPPVPPGLERLPAPGEVAVSPALRDLLATTPPEALAARLPGTVTAGIGAAGLAYPEELVAVVGLPPDQLRAAGAAEISGLATTAPGLLVNDALRVILTIGAVGLLTPVVIFIAASARVAAARREQRFAALRLVGATRGQVAAMAATETSLAAFAGVALGWVGYLLARPVVAARVTFDGAHFMAADVRAPAAHQLVVLLGVPLLTVAATVVALRRAQVTPLGVRQRVRTRAPGLWRLTPVALGVAGLATIASTDLANSSTSGIATAQLLIGGTFGSLLLGLVLAGPLLCSLLARLLSRLSRSMPELMAARRIAADPYTTFRAISGVAIAALVTTMFAGTAAGVEANLDRPAPDALRADAVEVLPGTRPAAPLLTAIRADPGVRGTVVARRDPAKPGAIAVPCRDLAAAVNLTCPAPPAPNGLVPRGLEGITRLDPPDERLPVHAIYVVTDGAPLTGERIRSLAPPGVRVSTGRDIAELDHRQLTELEAGLRLAMVFVLLVATASLTVGVAAGLVERRRPFTLLRATGLQLGELRRTILLETALPLVATAVCGIALGLAASAAVASPTGRHWTGPGPAFFLTAVAGLIVTLAVSSTTLPLVKTVTEPTSVRFE